MPTPDFITHPWLGTARVADLLSYRRATSARVSLSNAVTAKYLADLDDDPTPPAAPASRAA